MKVPFLMRGGLSNRVFIVTKARTVGATVHIDKKYDVTEQFVEIAHELSDDWWNKQSDRVEVTVGPSRDGHRFDHAMPYAWGGYRFVCSCGESGLVVPDEDAARADHGRHANSRRDMAEPAGGERS